MRTTRYFEEQVLRKRSYLRRERLGLPATEAAAQPDGRRRRWVRVEDAPPDGATRWLRIVLLDDGVTVHNAFVDRNFTPPVAEEPS